MCRIIVEGGINVEAGKFQKNNKCGGCNKRGGWKIFTKSINVEGSNKRGGWKILTKIINVEGSNKCGGGKTPPKFNKRGGMQ